MEKCKNKCKNGDACSDCPVIVDQNEEDMREILFILMDEIIQLKEHQCENSGYNWQDEIKPRIDNLFDK